MPQNGINHPGVTALAQAFAVNPLLRVINLNDNTFTEKGAVAMAETLKTLRQVEVINFGTAWCAPRVPLPLQMPSVAACPS